MPWCPSCSTELPAQKRKCPECGQDRSTGPGFTTPIEYLNREWFTIRSVDESEDAETLRMFLESKGCDVALYSGTATDKKKFKMNGNSGPGTLVLVPAEIASRAAKLIRNNDWASADDELAIRRHGYNEEHFDFEDEVLDDEGDYFESGMSADVYEDYESV